MLKKNRRIVLLAIAVLLATAFIFSNSLKNSAQSNADSGVFLVALKPIVDRIFGVDVVDMNIVVRKGAHLFEFGLLGALTAALVSAVKSRCGKSWRGYDFFYVLAVAVADEFIQKFTGRTSAVEDVILDFAGALLGCGLVLFAAAIQKRRKRRIQNAP